MGLLLALALTVAQAGAVPAPSQASAAAGSLESAIEGLGSFDFAARTDAARRIRRAPPADVVPLLARAVEHHSDEYVRFRAMVLLTAIDPSAAGRLAGVVVTDRNDRLRTVAYQWYEHHPDAGVVPLLIDALGRETSEFVRPALLRALAALAADEPRARDAVVPLVERGEDFFRGATITALGDFRVRSALEEIVEVARLEGPLQDDAVTALGRLGDGTARSVLSALQTSALPELQPSVSAALCLLGIDCEARLAYLADTLRFTIVNEEHQPLLRGAVHALGVLATAGRVEALEVLLSAVQTAPERARAPVALGVGTVALRRPDLVLDAVTAAEPTRADRIADLLLEGFDMLSEDFEEERFYAAIRREYWTAPDGSARRQASELLIERLEF